MKYKVDISPLAYSEIIDSVSFLKKVSSKAAEELFQNVIQAIRSLEDFPLRYPTDETFKVSIEEERKMVLGNGRYQIFYCVVNDTVYVECFHDSRKQQR